MTKANRILGILIATSTSVISLNAQAERYMVKMRSPSSFKNEVQALREAFKTGRFSHSSSKILGDRVRYVDSLSNMNLMVVDTDDLATVEGLRMNPEVEYVEQERWIKLPATPLTQAVSGATSAVSAEEITWGLKAVQAPLAWDTATQGAKGAGVRVVVIDSGIDKSHVDLADRFEKGEDFLSRRPDPLQDIGNIVTELFASPIDDVFVQQPSDTVPYPYFDQMGHGTHVAGTIAASQNGQGVVGVAPEARILAGRVCGSLGCSTVGIVRAIDWAIAEKADVINMSLGGPFPSMAQFEATQRAEAAGITVVAAAGNDGSAQLGYPAAFPTVVSVGALTPKLTRAVFSQHGQGLTITAPGTEVNSSVPAGTGRGGKAWVSSEGVDREIAASSFLGSNPTAGIFGADLVFAKLGSAEDFAALAPGQARGKVVLIQRGIIPFTQKVENAISAGAAGVVIYNNEAGLMSGSLTEDGANIGIPVVMIEQTEGETLAVQLIEGKKPMLRVEVKATDFAAFQGTSMASPHVAGVVALIKAANPSLTPLQIRAVLKLSAERAEHMNEFEYGAGLSNAARAISFIENTRENDWNNDNQRGSNPSPLAKK